MNATIVNGVTLPQSWFNWHETATEAVRYAHRQCIRWNAPWYNVYYSPSVQQYLVGLRGGWHDEVHIASVCQDGAIKRFI